jgi:8-amino-7-oxononanoate synthase
MRRLTLFSLNDYLGLASHPEVCQAAASASLHLGMGPRSSAIVGGTTSLHRELEEALSDLKCTQETLLFPTGYAANMSVVSSLCEDGNVDVFSDELNHASIVDGSRLAMRSSASSTGNRLFVYKHNDLQDLDAKLYHAAKSLPQGARRRRLVVTDSLFSMDGDFADLSGIVDLKRKHGFLLAVDEAHATLVCGDRGGGAAEAQGVAHHVDVHIGTLSKAFGSLGGFVSSTRAVKQLLLNRGRPYVYSTSLPLPCIAASLASLSVSRREGQWRRAHVWNLATRLGSLLSVPSLSPIIPLVLGAESTTMEVAGALLREGMHVPAIRPPTVPKNTSRLRVSLSAAHSMLDVQILADRVRPYLSGEGPRP